MSSRSVIMLALLLASALVVPAAAAPYEGRVSGQSYDIRFTLRDGRITNLVATVLVDCDRDGHRESLVISSRGSWRVRRGRFSATRVRSVGPARAHLTFRGTVRLNVVRGTVRERHTVRGSGTVCDTSRRGFTARRA